MLTVTSASVGESKTFRTPLGTFRYTRIPQNRFFSAVERTVGDGSRDEQSEVLDFVEFLKHRKPRKVDEQFKEFSLDMAMRGMADEPELYSENDLQEPMPASIRSPGGSKRCAPT